MSDRLLYLGGEWVSGPSTIDVINPATGEVIGTTSVADRAIVERAVALGQVAQREWANMGPAGRRTVLLAVAEGIREAAEPISWQLTAEQGKPFNDSLKEVLFGADVFAYYAEEAMRMPDELRPSYASSSVRALVQRRPIGVVSGIVPWNYPVDLWCWKVAGALAGGNAVVVKPPVETPLAAGMTVAAMEGAGLPPGILADLPGGRDVGEALVTTPGIGMVSVTASTATGQAILRASAEHLPRVLLELGGHAPFVVLDDADVARAASAAARRSFSNMGQICIAVNRVIVAESVADAFVEALAEEATNAVPGPTSSADTRYGSFTTAEGKNRTRQQIEDAQGRGARLVAGGGDPTDLRPETHMNPAVLDRVPLDAEVMHTETFGPLVGVHRVNSTEEALAVANELPYGLAAYVFSGSLERGLRLAEQLDVGMVGVNVNDTSELTAPFGGWKMSGFGSELGPEGLRAYTNPRTIRMQL